MDLKIGRGGEEQRNSRKARMITVPRLLTEVDGKKKKTERLSSKQMQVTVGEVFKSPKRGNGEEGPGSGYLGGGKQDGDPNKVGPPTPTLEEPENEKRREFAPSGTKSSHEGGNERGNTVSGKGCSVRIYRLPQGGKVRGNRPQKPDA